MNRLLGVLVCVGLVLLNGGAVAAAERKVTFVCEHGVAKSVIAAAIFNREAALAGLKVAAQARGVTPEAQLQPATVQGLERDGLETSSFVPARVSEKDAEESELAITIGVAVEPSFLPREKLREWNSVPPVSNGYEAARDSLTLQVKALVNELSRQAK